MKEMKFDVVDMYSSFPIDFYLYHPDSNYVKEPKNGKSAHRARIELDLLMSKNGLENYHKLCQMWAKCGVGRDFTIVIESLK